MTRPSQLEKDTRITRALIAVPKGCIQLQWFCQTGRCGLRFGCSSSHAVYASAILENVDHSIYPAAARGSIILVKK